MGCGSAKILHQESDRSRKAGRDESNSQSGVSRSCTARLSAYHSPRSITPASTSGIASLLYIRQRLREGHVKRSSPETQHLAKENPYHEVRLQQSRIRPSASAYECSSARQYPNENFRVRTTTSGTSRIRVTLSSDGSMLEIETEKLSSGYDTAELAGSNRRRRESVRSCDLPVTYQKEAEAGDVTNVTRFVPDSNSHSAQSSFSDSEDHTGYVHLTCKGSHHVFSNHQPASSSLPLVSGSDQVIQPTAIAGVNPGGYGPSQSSRRYPSPSTPVEELCAIAMPPSMEDEIIFCKANSLQYYPSPVYHDSEDSDILSLHSCHLGSSVAGTYPILVETEQEMSPPVESIHHKDKHHGAFRILPPTQFSQDTSNTCSESAPTFYECDNRTAEKNCSIDCTSRTLSPYSLNKSSLKGKRDQSVDIVISNNSSATKQTRSALEYKQGTSCTIGNLPSRNTYSSYKKNPDSTKKTNEFKTASVDPISNVCTEQRQSHTPVPSKSSSSSSRINDRQQKNKTSSIDNTQQIKSKRFKFWKRKANSEGDKDRFGTLTRRLLSIIPRLSFDNTSSRHQRSSIVPETTNPPASRQAFLEHSVPLQKDISHYHVQKAERQLVPQTCPVGPLPLSNNTSCKRELEIGDNTMQQVVEVGLVASRPLDHEVDYHVNRVRQELECWHPEPVVIENLSSVSSGLDSAFPETQELECWGGWGSEDLSPGPVQQLVMIEESGEVEVDSGEENLDRGPQESETDVHQTFFNG